MFTKLKLIFLSNSAAKRAIYGQKMELKPEINIIWIKIMPRTCRSAALEPPPQKHTTDPAHILN